MLGVAIVNPVLIIVAGAAGVGVSHVAGFNPHFHELLLASIATLLASEIALVPHFLKSDNTPASSFQAAFLGTMIHLGLSLILGAGIVLMLKPATAFIWWLMPMYWVTLIGICTIFIRSMRSPVGSNKTATN